MATNFRNEQTPPLWHRPGTKMTNEQDPNNPKAWHYRHYGPSDTVHLVSIDLQIEVAEFYRELVFDDEEK